MSKQKPLGYYVDMSNKYMSDVLNDNIPTCRWTKLAVQRQLNDLERMNSDPSFPYVFDVKAAERICRFSELLTHTKGAKAKQKFVLEPWQVFLDSTAFGWVHKETGYRRFRVVYTEVGKKNGKSFMTSPVGHYMLVADGERGSEVYIAASQREQTKHVFEACSGIVKDNPEFKNHYGIEQTKFAIYQPSTSSTLTRLARDSGGNTDGMNPHCAIIDELHAHKTRDTFDAITSAIGARTQPLLWIITTAGFNRSSVCFEQHTYLKRILMGSHQDDSFFGCIWSIDDGDDIEDENTWIKANPNYGVSVQKTFLQDACTKAIGSSASMSNFLTKNLNVWVNADSAWMNMHAWDKCADESLKMEDFKHDNCYVGCDLASKKDFASVAKLFVRKIEGKKHYYLFVDHFQNRKAMEDSSADMLSGWERDGYIHVNDGNVTDFQAIREHIQHIHKEYNVKQISFDPKEATDMRRLLSDDKVDTFEYHQNLGTMSEPTLEFEALVLDGRIHHTGDPVLSWMVSNVVGHMNAKQQIYPKRDLNQRDQKIDGAIASIIALGSEMQNLTKDSQPQIFIFKKRRGLDMSNKSPIQSRI